MQVLKAKIRSTRTKPDGWIAWRINPTGTPMVGTQALITFKNLNDTIVVKTFKWNLCKSIDSGVCEYGVSNKEGMYMLV